MEPRRGRQTPICSVVLPYKNTRGQEAIELYRLSKREPPNDQHKHRADNTVFGV